MSEWNDLMTYISGDDASDDECEYCPDCGQQHYEYDDCDPDIL